MIKLEWILLKKKPRQRAQEGSYGWTFTVFHQDYISNLPIKS